MNKRLSLAFLSIGLLSILVMGCSKPLPVETHLQGKTMGTSYNVKYARQPDQKNQRIHRAIEEALLRVNKLMSTYDPNSELSGLNQYRGSDIYPLSDETRYVIAEAIDIAKQTDGALDITIGPVVNLWGFGPTQRPEIIPSQTDIVEALNNTGLSKFTLTDEGVIKHNPNIYVDLSTIAKGYGVDVVSEVLETFGILDYLVEIGGEMRVAGIKPAGVPWRIAIEKPVTAERSVQKVIEIGSNGIATSGDYRNYYEQDGIRYSHIIEPSTGYPIQHSLVSVTVVHPSAMTADGLATGLMVLGTEKAKVIAEQENLEVLLISKEGEQIVEWASPKFVQNIKTVSPQ